MAGMADQQNMAAKPLVAHSLLVHLGHQRTGGVR
jgi:hypothetical protein